MTNKASDAVQAVILDWAGTTVDYGCFAPVAAFIHVFEKRGIGLTAEEVREPMGMLKRDHMQALCRMERIRNLWLDKFGKEPDEAVVDELYAEFEPVLFEQLSAYSDPIPGVVTAIDRMRKQGIKIGSTSGYTTPMLEVVAREAERKGYSPDYRIASDQVPAGRPAPYMCFRNALELQVYPLEHCIKVGDTVSDVREGVNAGMWSVGIMAGGSELGLTLEEVEALPAERLAARMNVVRDKFIRAGAHFVIDSFGDIETVIERVNERLAAGGHPRSNRAGQEEAI